MAVARVVRPNGMRPFVGLIAQDVPVKQSLISVKIHLGSTHVNSTYNKEHPMAKPPAHEIRLGLIKASIWQNQSKHGVNFTVNVVRLYRNGNEWKESTRFHRDDLLLVAKIMNEAHMWIFQSLQENPICATNN